MKADNLEEAIAFVNQTGYGLTSGLQSLDQREQEVWTERIRAGNLYINRGTTGAVVLRQPFGGMGLSAFGPGIKAGGINYVAQFMAFEQSGAPETKSAEIDPLLGTLKECLLKLDDFPADDIQRVLNALDSYAHHHKTEFGRMHDPVRLVGEDNFRRYLTVEHLRIRIHPRDGFFDIFARVCAARTAGCRITVSAPPGYHPPVLQRLYALTESWAGNIELVEESDQQLAEVIGDGLTDRVRYAAPDRIPEIVYRAAAEVGQYIAGAPVLAEGRIELLWYLREQTVTHQYHRYGNLLDRAEEERSEVL
jgi:RHH-type proline utilization regulon transcriptional repressor/proline dehydrogenase/delta 1-pyrroline-5-carboxylate dehydrogenase